MIHFETLNVGDDGLTLNLKVSLDTNSIYTDIVISGIRIYPETNFVSTDSPGTAIYEELYDASTASNTVEMAILPTDLTDPLIVDFKSNLFFVLIECKLRTVDAEGNTVLKSLEFSDLKCPDKGYPSGVGVTCWKYPVYQASMNFVREVENNCCDIPKSFLDFILRINAFRFAVRTKNYVLAIRYWKKFLLSSSLRKDTTKRGCGCRDVTTDNTDDPGLETVDLVVKGCGCNGN